MLSDERLQEIRTLADNVRSEQFQLGIRAASCGPNDGEFYQSLKDEAESLKQREDVIRDLLAHIDGLDEELVVFSAAGVAEIAARNPSVLDYMQHWEGRATAAEAEAARLRGALELVMPMARGYANEHDVGCNRASIKQADEALTPSPAQQSATVAPAAASEPVATAGAGEPSADVVGDAYAFMRALRNWVNERESGASPLDAWDEAARSLARLVEARR